MLATPGIAVLGSCVTRDVWSLAGPEESRPLVFLGRTSLASLTLPDGRDNRLPALIPRLPELPPFTARSLRAELVKDALAQIAALRPAALIIDFIDERFDLLDADGVLLTESYELIQSGLCADPALATARRIPRLGEEAWSLWEEGLTRLRRELARPGMAGCRLLLHACFWAEEIQAEDRREALPDGCEILPGRLASRAAHNALLRRCLARFQEVFPEAITIAPPAALRVADTAHRWGPAPFHFIPPYYRAFATACAEAGLALWDRRDAV